MKTYPFKEEDGRLIAFEVDNIDIWLRRITTLLSKLEDVTEIQKKKASLGSSEIHIEFKYNNTDFVVWEMYGDNNRYWIGPKDDKEPGIDITEVESVFRQFNQSVTPKVVMWIILGAVLCQIFWGVI